MVDKNSEVNREGNFFFPLSEVLTIHVILCYAFGVCFNSFSLKDFSTMFTLHSTYTLNVSKVICNWRCNSHVKSQGKITPKV